MPARLAVLIATLFAGNLAAVLAQLSDHGIDRADASMDDDVTGGDSAVASALRALQVAKHLLQRLVLAELPVLHVANPHIS